MEHTAAQAVFILGDLFEVWVGDDAVAVAATTQSDGDGFEDRCARILKRCAAHRNVFFMRGNRDFLVGEAFTRACGVQLLDDPTVLNFADQRWLLSHGDALCLDDTDYMQFRAMVRGVAWQQEFLGQSVAKRKEIARALRARSEERKKSNAVMIDVDMQEAIGWLVNANATCLIHGHTHRPADHDLGGGLRRVVLSDWDLHASPPRAQVLRITSGTGAAPATVQRLVPQAI